MHPVMGQSESHREGREKRGAESGDIISIPWLTFAHFAIFAVQTDTSP